MSRPCCKRLPLISKHFLRLSAGPRDMKCDMDSHALHKRAGSNTVKMVHWPSWREDHRTPSNSGQHHSRMASSSSGCRIDVTTRAMPLQSEREADQRDTEHEGVGTDRPEQTKRPGAWRNRHDNSDDH